MPLLKIDGHKLALCKLKNFALEKNLQHLVEKNLETVFNCRFVATEFSTGADHAGRIDTLALSEECHPVIVEYKKTETSDLVNQSLFYLSWLNDHRGDFEMAVHKSIGSDAEVDWSAIRVICIAPGFKKYDLHAVKVMGANIELWQYRLFDDEFLYLDEVYRRSTHLLGNVGDSLDTKNPAMVAAGKKGAITRANGVYTLEEHLQIADEPTLDLVNELRDYIMALGDSVEEVPKKKYIAYKTAQNFVCMIVRKKTVDLFFKLTPSEIDDMPPNARDVTNIGHYGTGNFKLQVGNEEQCKGASRFIDMAYQKIGG